MSQKNKTQLKAINNANFPNNNSAFITPEKLRDFNNDMIDSMLIDVDSSLSGSISITGSLVVTNSVSASIYYGDGSNLTGITAVADWNTLANKPSGIVSGSSQVNLAQAFGTASQATTASFAESSISSSYAGVASLAQSVSYVNVTGKPTLVSGSSQISFNGITDKPTLVSGSSQIDYTGLSNIPSGIVSSSSQVSFNGITDKPTLVSGSSQIDLSQATGIATSASHAEVADLALTSTNSTYAQNTITTGKNLSGVEILKGTPLYFTGSGTSGNLVGVYPADAGNPSRMPAGGIAGETIAIDAEGIVLLDGYIGNVNTDGLPSGAKVYVGVGGGYTTTPPTGSAKIQYLGNIEKSAVNGSGVIQMHGESRGLPNLTQNNVWVGDVNGVPQEVNKNNLGLALTGSNNIFTGNQTFTDITVNGTGSFAHINYVTGSATIIGDAYIVLNNDTPTERFAGIVVQDSGSANTTASFEFDGLNNDWFYEYSDDGGITTDHGVALFGPEYSTKGTPTYPTNNRLQKGMGGHHLLDSNITDDGSKVSINSNLEVTGSIALSGTVDGVDVAGLKNDFDNLSSKTLVSGSDQVTASLDVRYASLTSNQFNGNQGITGSVQIDGSAIITGSLLVNGTGANLQWNTNWPSNFNTKQIIDYGDLTTSEGDAYNDNFQRIFNFGSVGANLEGVVTAFNDSGASNYYTSQWIGPRATYWLMLPNGASQDSTISLVKNSGAPTTTATITADSVNINGTVTINGATTVNGSSKSSIETVTPASNIATIDFSAGSLFELTLEAGANTEIQASNVSPGQTLNLLITQNGTTAGTVSFSSDFLQPSGSGYTPTTDLGAQDILTLMTYSDTSKIYVVATNKFQ